MRAVRRTICEAVLGVTMIMTLGACGGSTSPQPSPSKAPQAGQSPPGSRSAAAETNPSGDIPDSQVYVPYSPSGGLFTIKVPEGWARTQDGTAVVFSDKLNSVRADVGAVDRRSEHRLRAGPGTSKIKAGAQGFFSPGNVTAVGRKAGQAILITYRASSAPNPVTGKVVTDAVERYEFWKVGHEVVLSLSGPVSADNVDPWRIITDSLRWTA